MLKINGIEIDLRQIQIEFIPNEDQIAALTRLTDFVLNQEYDLLDAETNLITLSGAAGTGKSSVVKIFIEILRRSGYNTERVKVTAPTNRAVQVIEQLSGKSATTIHKLLNLRPDIDIEKIDFKNLKFNISGLADMPIKGILIIDECSMVNDFLFELLETKSYENKTKIIYIGDQFQLKPAKSEEISTCFKIENKISLLKVERQSTDNPLCFLYDKIRADISSRYDTFEKETNVLESENKGVVFTQDQQEFLSSLTEDFKSKEFQENKLFARGLHYTNDMVQTCNKMVRQGLNYDQEYHAGELLMGYSNFAKEFVYDIRNSCDYEILEASQSSIWLDDIELPGWDLKLESLMKTGMKVSSIFMLSENVDEDTLLGVGELLDEYRSQAIHSSKTKDGKAKMYWAMYYAAFGQFATPFDIIVEGRTVKPKTLDYGYNITVHKSQGGTFHNVHVNFSDINICRDIELTNQLKYVALSRPTHKATVIY